eukprot:maker-scaffold384_size188899-snap-gene-0.31 protein:Tk06447 transcript:maker-scaffold384_size188899-snap-gene-0.31-mRNA-1 annotation:"rna pseudouridylate synthase domain-containing protein 3"
MSTQFLRRALGPPSWHNQWRPMLPRALASDASHRHHPEKSSKMNIVQELAQVGRFRTLDDLVEHLASNVLYHEPDKASDGLVAINKPHGLPRYQTDNCPVSLEKALPALAKMLEVKTLLPIKMPERHCSGVCLMAKSEESKARITKILAGVKHDTRLIDNYWVLTNGFPRFIENLEVFDQSLHLVGVRAMEKGQKHVEPILSRVLMSDSATARIKKRKGDVPNRIRVHSKTLARSGLGKAALVSVQPTKTSNNFIFVYMNDLLSPIIGDHLYSYRCRVTMGVMSRINYSQAPTNIPTQVNHFTHSTCILLYIQGGADKLAQVL